MTLNPEDSKVYFASNEKKESQPLDYITALSTTNPMLAKKGLASLATLPFRHISRNKTKPYELNSGMSCNELTVRHKTDTSRYMYTLHKSDFIVHTGFTKKDRKTRRKEKLKAIRAIKKFNNDPKVIKLPE